MFTKVKTCKVCADGALFLSQVRYCDNFNVPCGRGLDYPIWNIEEDFSPKYFSKNQQVLIELAFEMGIGHYEGLNYYGKEEVAQRAVDFCRDCTSSKSKLIKILKNIIDNKGTFKP